MINPDFIDPHNFSPDDYKERRRRPEPDEPPEEHEWDDYDQWRVDCEIYDRMLNGGDR